MNPPIQVPSGPLRTHDTLDNAFAIRWLQRLLESGSICFMAKEPASLELTRFVPSAQKRQRGQKQRFDANHGVAAWFSKPATDRSFGEARPRSAGSRKLARRLLGGRRVRGGKAALNGVEKFGALVGDRVKIGQCARTVPDSPDQVVPQLSRVDQESD
jgi:hypothetical protein